MAEYKIVLGYTAVVVSLALAIFCMTTYGWVTATSGGCSLSVGLKQYKLSCDDGYSESGSVSSMSDSKKIGVSPDQASNLDKGGTAVIVCGSFGSLCCVIAGIFFFLSLSRPHAWYRWGAIGCAYLSGLLFVIGCVVYAKDYDLDYSFILCTFCSFGYLLAATVMLSAGVGSGGGSGGSAHQNKQQAPTQFDG